MGGEQSLLSHLVELRSRLLRMVLGTLVIFLILAPFANGIYEILANPLMAQLPGDQTMIAIDPVSPFLAPIKLTLILAIFIAMPWILFQLWAFVAPGLYRHEKQLVLPIMASSIGLFYAGAAFAYYVILPIFFAFITATAPVGVAVMTDISRYLDFVLVLFFAFGLAFEVPVATVILVLAGIAHPDKLAAKRPYIILAAFVIGMLLTPPDVISQTLLALPMWLLFEIGLVLARLLIKRRGQLKVQ